MKTNTPASHQALLQMQPLDQPKPLGGHAHLQWQAVAIIPGTADCASDTLTAAALGKQLAQQQKTIVGRRICNSVHAFNSRRKRAAKERVLEQKILQLFIENKSLNDSNTAIRKQLQLMQLDNIVLEEMLQFQAKATGLPLDPVHNNGSIFWGAPYPLEELDKARTLQDYRQQLEHIVDCL